MVPVYKIFIFTIIFAVFLGCNRTRINVSYNENADYDRFETFGWLKTDRETENMQRVDNQRLEKLITMIVDSMMVERGYELLNEGDPDLLITWYAGVSGDVIRDQAGYSYGQWVDQGEEISKEGILIIDIIDNEKRELFWRGKGTSVLDDPEEAREEVNRITEKIFSRFPERFRE